MQPSSEHTGKSLTSRTSETFAAPSISAVLFDGARRGATALQACQRLEVLQRPLRAPQATQVEASRARLRGGGEGSATTRRLRLGVAVLIATASVRRLRATLSHARDSL